MAGAASWVTSGMPLLLANVVVAHVAMDGRRAQPTKRLLRAPCQGAGTQLRHFAQRHLPVPCALPRCLYADGGRDGELYNRPLYHTLNDAKAAAQRDHDKNRDQGR